MITVYSKKPCSQCDATIRFLEKHHIEHTVIDISQDEDIRTRLVADGWGAAPIVDPGDGSGWWSNFRLDRLRALAATHKAAS